MLKGARARRAPARPGDFLIACAKRRPANAGGTLRMLAGRLGHARPMGARCGSMLAKPPALLGVGFTASASLLVRLFLLRLRILLHQQAAKLSLRSPSAGGGACSALCPALLRPPHQT